MNRRFAYGAVAVSMGFTAASSGLAKSPTTGLDGNEQLQRVTDTTGVAGLEVVRLQNGVQVCTGKTVKNIIFYGPETVRVNANLGKPLTEHASLVVTGEPDAPELKITEENGDAVVASGKLTIRVDSKTAALTFLKPDGTVILREDTQNPADIKEIEISDAQTYEVTQRFTLKDRESLYGLGQIFNRMQIRYFTINFVFPRGGSAMFPADLP